VQSFFSYLPKSLIIDIDEIDKMEARVASLKKNNYDWIG
jgi:DUF1365 family protein